MRIGYDEVAPTYESGSIDATAVTLTFNEVLDTASVPAGPARSPLRWTARPQRWPTPIAVAIDGATVTLTLAAAPAAAATATATALTVAYTGPSANPLRDPSHNNVEDFTASLSFNQAPTGKPTIGGTARVGEVLTADIGGIADAGWADEGGQCRDTQASHTPTGGYAWTA